MNSRDYRKILLSLNFKPSYGYLFLHILEDLALLFGVCWLLGQGLYGWLASSVILPILYFRAFAMMHDGVHGSIVKNRKLNDAIAIVYSVLNFLPFKAWQDIHLDHHKWAGNYDKDPAAGLIKAYDPRRDYSVLNFCWKYWVPLLAFKQERLFWSLSFKYLFSDKKSVQEKSYIGLTIVVPLLCYIGAVWFMGPVAFLSVVVPSLIIYLVGVEVINFPHHLQLPMSSGEKLYPNFEHHKFTRSCKYPDWISYAIINNFNYHIEHHFFPRLPWYRLKSARAFLKSSLGQDYKEINKNQWILENRQYKMSSIIKPVPAVLESPLRREEDKLLIGSI